MTIDEFNNTKFGAGDKVIYHGKKYPIASVDFEECLVGLDMECDLLEDIQWKRCENVIYVTSGTTTVEDWINKN